MSAELSEHIQDKLSLEAADPKSERHKIIFSYDPMYTKTKFAWDIETIVCIGYMDYEIEECLVITDFGKFDLYNDILQKERPLIHQAILHHIKANYECY